MTQRRTDDDRALRGLPPHLAAKTRRTRFAMGLGRFARAFWPVWVVGALGAAAFMAGLPGALSPVAATAAYAVFGLILAAVLARGFMRFSVPTRREALDTLDEGLARRAASGLDDRPVAGGEMLWHAHRARLDEEARAATPPKADIDLSADDPWRLRYAAAVLLALGALGSYLGTPARLHGTLVPDAPAAPPPVLASAEAWLSPPAYTGAAPVYLTERAGERIEAPAGAEVTLRVTGSTEAPIIRFGAVETVPLNEADGVWTAELTVTENGALSAANNSGAIADWQIEIIPDAAPVVMFTRPPAPTDQKALELAYDAWDDYGLTGAWAEIALARDGAPDEPLRLDLPYGVAAPDGGYSGVIAEDLTAHPWAGLPVRLTLYARDGADQVGESEPVEITLPTRVFTEPMAKALLEERRELAWDEALAVDAADRLDAMLDYPETYFRDSAAFLGASFAQKRLFSAVEAPTDAPVAAARADAIEFLWRAALRLEDGTLSDALEQLRQAQERLSDALERGAPEEEIAKLMDELRKAIDKYMQALANEARENPDSLAEQQQGQQGQEMNQSSLQDLLDQLEETARNGDPDQAQQMLALLQQLLENLQMAQGGQGQGEQQNGAAQQLQEMIQRQQDLTDETFESLREGRTGNQQGQQGQPQQGQGQQQGQQQGQGQQGQQGQGQQGQGQQGQGQQGQGQQGQGQTGQRPDGSWGVDPGNGEGGGQNGRSDLAGRQGDLRDDLGGVRGGRAGEDEATRDALRRADDAMGRAREGLAQGELGDALDDQVRALDELREGARALAEAQREAQGENGRQEGGAGGLSAGRLDPFGRLGRSLGADDGEGVTVPEDRARNRALEIQRELRRRSSERERDAEELDYLERLQDRF